MNEAPPLIPQNDYVQDQGEVKTSKAAIWSLVFGISSFCLWFLGTIPALALGITALVKINSSQGRLQGRGLAIAGLVTGGSGIIVGMTAWAFVAAMMMPAFKGIQENAKITKQVNNSRQVILACRTYAADWDGKFPEALDDLLPDYLDDESLLRVLDPDTGELLPYMYFPGKTDLSESRSLLIASPVVFKKDTRVVGFCGGAVAKMKEEEFIRLVELEHDGR